MDIEEKHAMIENAIFSAPADSPLFDLANILADVMLILCEKNAAYGNSASDPLRLFSSCSPVEQIAVRIDDKLSRIRKSGWMTDDSEDTVKDLIGYLTFLVRERERKPASNDDLKGVQEFEG